MKEGTSMLEKKRVVKASETAFSIAALQEHCRELFDVSKAAFTGATVGIEKRDYTVKEMKSIIEKWCRQEAR